MKKAILLVSSLSVSIFGWAQKQNIQTASNYLKDNDYAKAIEYINMATADPTTKDNPKAWFVRGSIYMQMQNDTSKKAEKPFKEAGISYMKVAQLDSKYEKDFITDALKSIAYAYYNDAATAYNKKNYDEVFSSAKSFIDIYNIDGGKRYNDRNFDTLASDALILQAFGAYYAKKYDDALPVLLNLKSHPIGKKPEVFIALADIYKIKNSQNEMLSVLEEGRALYPDNVTIRNEELNYYILSGKQETLLKKLEDAVAKDPNSVELLSSVANTYNRMAFPTDANGKEQPKPTNYLELLAKAEGYYNKLISVQPENGSYIADLGIMHYNQAMDYIKQMNEAAELGNKAKAAADKKKHEDAYNQLSTMRDAAYDKAIPSLEKSVSILEPKLASLSQDDKFSYQSALIALKEIYARRNNMDKSGVYKAKLEALKGKK